MANTVLSDTYDESSGIREIRYVDGQVIRTDSNGVVISHDNIPGNQQQYSAKGQKLKQSSSSGKSGKSSDKVEDGMEQYINYLKEALKESSGWKREELQMRLDDAERDRESRIKAAEISADASRYGSDKSLEGTKYASNNTYNASIYGSDKSLEGTKYSADAGERNSQRSLEGTKYGADAGLAGTKYSTDADLYKFDAKMPLEQADRALQFLNQYTQLSQRPDDYLQAANYARLGRQVGGNMPVMMQQLLGQINPQGYSRGGSSANMPQTAAQAMFGDQPLQLGTRQAMPSRPVMQYPGQYTTQTGIPVPGQTMQVASPPVPGQTPMQQQGFLASPTQAQGGYTTMLHDRGGYAPDGSPLAEMKAMPQGQQVEGMPMRVGKFQPAGQVAGGMAIRDGGFLAHPADTSSNVDPRSRYLNTVRPDGQGTISTGAMPRPATQRPGSTTGQPRGAYADFAPPSTKDGAAAQLEAGGRELVRRGAARLGSQKKERMTGTELGLTNSSLKAAGGTPEDFWQVYDRTRIGNDGSTRLG